MRKLLCLASFLLVGCSSGSSSPEATVHTHLKLATAGDLEHIQYQCHLDGELHPDARDPLDAAIDWEIESVSVVPQEDGDSMYEVSVEIQERGSDGSNVPYDWIFEVHESEEIYESNLRLIDQGNRLTGGVGELPDRDEFSPKKFCLTGFKRQEF